METDNGWIKIKCDIRQHWLWQDSEKLFWWLDMLLIAEKEDRKVLYDSKLITIKRGCMLAGVPTLCERWGKCKKTIIAFLRSLEETGMIEREVQGRSASIIKVCNFDDFYTPYERPLHSLIRGNLHSLILDLISCDTSDLRGVPKEDLHALMHLLGNCLKEKETKKEKEKVPHTPYKEKEINKEKEFVVVDAHTHTRESALDLRPYHARLEAIAMSCHIKPQELEYWIQEFNLHLEAVGETYNDANQYLLRLKNWINKRQEIMRNATNNHSTRNSQPDFSQRVSGAAAVALGFIRECNAGGTQTQSSGGGLSADVLPF